MRKKNLKQKLMLFGLLAAGVIIIALIVILVLGKRSLDRTKEQVTQLSTELSSNRQLVYVAARNIAKGEQVTSENVMQQQIYTGLGMESFMKGEELGKTAVVDIRANEPVMANMVTAIKLTKDTRKYEIASAHLMTTQSMYDTVDIRIMFPNGEDYLLLAKKPVMDLQMGTSIFTTYMNEDEIMRMASAMVDAYTTTGAKIYTTKYVEENIQEEAIPNYPVKAAVLDLINADPNIVEQAETTLNLRARNDLDQRLGALSPEQLAAVAAGLNLEDTAKGGVIREGLMNESGDGTISGNTPNVTDNNQSTSTAPPAATPTDERPEPENETPPEPETFNNEQTEPQLPAAGESVYDFTNNAQTNQASDDSYGEEEDTVTIELTDN